ncbi:MAG: CDP-alcohol phosphatidyltransferase family protein [Phycisphaerales bacterium]
MKRRSIGHTNVPLRKLIPNMITTAALCSGVAALHFASRPDPDFARAVGAVGMAALLDALDGRAARLLKATSRFGETFDSLSDFVCFGVAPAFLIYRFCQRDQSLLGFNLEGLVFLAVVLFALCSAVRLARFTATQRKKKPGAKPSRFFTGMPTPAAAGAALIPPMLLLSDIAVRLPTVMVIGHTLLIAALMVSRMPMYSFKRLRIARVWVMPMMLAIGAVVVAATRDAWLTAACICAAYLLSLPFSLRGYQRDAAKEASEALLVAPAAGEAAPGSPAR